jgi:hypothetical protein
MNGIGRSRSFTFFSPLTLTTKVTKPFESEGLCAKVQLSDRMHKKKTQLIFFSIAQDL